MLDEPSGTHRSDDAQSFRVVTVCLASAVTLRIGRLLLVGPAAKRAETQRQVRAIAGSRNAAASAADERQADRAAGSHPGTSRGTDLRCAGRNDFVSRSFGEASAIRDRELIGGNL